MQIFVLWYSTAWRSGWIYQIKMQRQSQSQKYGWNSNTQKFEHLDCFRTFTDTEMQLFICRFFIVLDCFEYSFKVSRFKRHEKVQTKFSVYFIHLSHHKANYWKMKRILTYSGSFPKMEKLKSIKSWVIFLFDLEKFCHHFNMNIFERLSKTVFHWIQCKYVYDIECMQKELDGDWKTAEIHGKYF